MYLKNINLRGFKSFASKSKLIFEPGISVIVGPNGSGKSNIADAISWVLGEQSPKSLRGTSMGDVIFRSKKEELAIAEVSVVFDNSDKLLPLEFREVKFTRRVYSKGGSEYFINSSPARLIDIQEMIADSGIGRGLYTIIGQGQINEVALLKPLERKSIIEEVLGISKHKIRRDKSISRLANVKEDVDRIDDLLQEIKRTMDPLKIEAERAKKFSDISNALKKEEISLFLSNMDDLNNKWDSENSLDGKFKQEQEEITKKINLAVKEKEEFKKQIKRMEIEFEYSDKKVKSFNSVEIKLNNIIALVESKKSMFNTLYNMFDKDFYNKVGSNFSQTKIIDGNKKINLQNSDKKNYDLIFKKLSSGIKRVEEMLGIIFKKLKKINIDKKTMVEIRKDEKLVKEELKTLLNMVENTSLKDVKETESIYLESDKSGNGSDDFGKGFEYIKKIKSFCGKNMEKSKKLLIILQKILRVSRIIKEKLYPEFNKKYNEIKEKQKNVNELNNLINEFFLKKAELENKIDKTNLKKEQIKEKVKDITSRIIDSYSMSIDYISKNYKPSEDLNKSNAIINKFKNELKKYENVNPNAAAEYDRIRERFEFLNSQKIDLIESKKSLENLIGDINKKIEHIFMEKFEEINKNFKYYFKVLFPLGEGELMLLKNSSSNKNYNIANSYDDIGVDLKVDIGNNKFVALSLLSGGEKSLVSIAFLFSIFYTKPLPFYVFDEIDAALDDINLDRFLSLVKKFSENQQIIIITHQKRTMEIADTIYGVSMQSNGVSRIISEKIESMGNNNYAKIN